MAIQKNGWKKQNAAVFQIWFPRRMLWNISLIQKISNCSPDTVCLPKKKSHPAMRFFWKLFKDHHIEGKTLEEMLKKKILPSISAYVEQIADTAVKKKTLIPGMPLAYDTELITTLSSLQAEISSNLASLLQNMEAAEALDDALLTAKAYHENVLSDMERIRSAVNEAEALIPDQYLSYPTYDQLLFSI